MNFMASPWIPALAAGLTIPPLVLLYFLKLKRREVPISSTLLWKRAVYDLQVNSPFQKLKNNLLLFLQLLILIAAILALAEPTMKIQRAFEETVVIMIDQSASMSTAEDEGKTRLEIAKEEALTTIENMNVQQRAMVIAFADKALVLSPFTSDKSKLINAVKGIEQTEASSSFTEAMTLAEAHSTPIGENIGTGTQVGQSQYILFTDGRLPDSDEVRVRRGKLEIVRIGNASENVGIVDLDVRRNYEKPEQLSVLARVRNFGSAPASRDVSLFVDGEVKSVLPTGELAPLATSERLGALTSNDVPPEENAAIVPFELILDGAAQIEVRLSGQDAFASDDRAYSVVTPPKAMSVLLVTQGNRFLRQIVDAMPTEFYDVWTPDEYESAEEDKLTVDGQCRFDVVIFDGYSTDRLPPGSYMFFAGVPLVSSVDAGDPVRDAVFLDWDETHPILRRVSVEPIIVVSWLDLKLPDNAVSLIEGTNGPVMALLNEGRNQYLITAFGIFNEDRTQLNTNWIDQEGIVVFFYNALRYLTGSSTTGQLASVSPGRAFTVPVKPGFSNVSVQRPDGKSDNVPVRANDLVTYGRTDRLGIYEVAQAVEGEAARAVNLLNDAESFIAPNREFRIAAGEVTTAEGVERVNQPLWPYLLMAFAALLLIEWAVYNKRMFV